MSEKYAEKIKSFLVFLFNIFSIVAISLGVYYLIYRSFPIVTHIEIMILLPFGIESLSFSMNLPISYLRIWDIPFSLLWGLIFLLSFELMALAYNKKFSFTEALQVAFKGGFILYLKSVTLPLLAQSLLIGNPITAPLAMIYTMYKANKGTIAIGSCLFAGLSNVVSQILGIRREHFGVIFGVMFTCLAVLAGSDVQVRIGHRVEILSILSMLVVITLGEFIFGNRKFPRFYLGYSLGMSSVIMVCWGVVIGICSLAIPLVIYLFCFLLVSLGGGESSKK